MCKYKLIVCNLHECELRSNRISLVENGDLERLTLLYFVVQQRTDKTHLLVV